LLARSKGSSSETLSNDPMRIFAQIVPSLPRLSWCARIAKSSEVVSVLHGPWVEARGNFFIEGAWAGDFSQGSFLDSDSLVGTGAVVTSEGITFATPSHPLQRLHFIQRDECVYASPSLVFALAASGSTLDPTYIPYQSDLQQLVKGISTHVGAIPLSGGGYATICHYRNIRIDRDLNFSFLPKSDPSGWRCYEDYVRYLSDRLAMIAANAAAPERTRQYRLLSTLSSGYDSTACAALARDAGCLRGISFKTSRPEGKSRPSADDDGIKVAEALGFDLSLFDRLAYRKRRDYPEAEFVSSGELGQEVYLSAAEGELEGTILVTGDHGDRVWDRLAKRVRRDIPRRSSAACSITEFRLRVGFIHLPLPLIGAQNHPELLNITRSGEMRPWTLGTRYDRPIARRIAEERGVPRGAFANEKKVVSVLLNNDKRICDQLSQQSLADFEKYYAEHRKSRSQAQQLFYECAFRSYCFYRRLLRVLPLDRCLEACGLRPDLLCPIPNKFRESPNKASFLVHWGLNKILARYDGAKFYAGPHGHRETTSAS
jgi:hypothetical protein